MIQINLLPGSAKRRTTGTPLSAQLAALKGQVKDPFLLVALLVVLVASGGVLTFWMGQGERATELAARHQSAAQDSARYATIVAEKRRAESERDSVVRQLTIIKTIDEDRYVWAHILDEVSRYLTPYTWITAVEQTNPVMSPAAGLPDSVRAKFDTTTLTTPELKKAAIDGLQAAIDSIHQPQRVLFKLVGRTADIQALTRFMRDMEASPFLQNVQLVSSTSLLEDGNAITQFELGAEFEAPDPAATRRVPLTVVTR